ncbi:globin domain-containing protein [Eisenibacter elegans]|jgi:hemoglobin-like flavoprotein|uniref:globin domain-containing protein n=1 Tax=Eisenibacter elegans TaxID=997 RepID=UPI00041ACC89|nr:globin domain-containing protein [Eisenibacter elegans]
MSSQKLNVDQIGLIKSSWGLIVAKAQTLGEHFYSELFRIHPEYERLFDSIDRSTQARKLTYVISLVVTKLDKLETIAEEVKYLGKRHKTYQVRVVHFEPFIKQLLLSLEDTLGAQWNTALAEAWEQVLYQVADAMKEHLK